MKVLEGLETITTPYAHSVVAIGTFDGIHVGHQAIIRTAVAEAHKQGRPALVFTFDRHPAELIAPERAPGYLTTPAQRNRLIASLGADCLVIARFDRSLSEKSPEAFVREILKGLLGAEEIVVGTNFFFGKGRAGDVSWLERHQATFRYKLKALEPVFVGNSSASSSRVRECLQAGDVAEAETVLGHPYLLAGTVVEGQKLGRTLGYPTANLALSYRQVAPADGIYAVRAILDDGQMYGGACSIGNRPTIEGAGRSIETYLFDCNADLYGRGMELRFFLKLRDEVKFDSLDALKVQMAEDVAQARSLLDTLPDDLSHTLAEK